jgi:hypothetical protein
VSLAHDLRAEFVEATAGPHPLVTIGLSPEILNLGLSTDDLYDYVTKDIARRLVMRFHPDRIAVDDVLTSHYQERFAAAYAQLQDRAAFDRALATFRNDRASTRADTRIHIEAIGELRRRLVGSQDQVRAIEQELRYVTAERDEHVRARAAAKDWHGKSVEYAQARDLAVRRRQWMAEQVAGLDTYLTRLAGSGDLVAPDRWVVSLVRGRSPATSGPQTKKKKRRPLTVFARSLRDSMTTLRTRHGLTRKQITAVRAQCEAMKQRFWGSTRVEVLPLTHGRLGDPIEGPLVLGSLPEEALETSDRSLGTLLARTLPALLPDHRLVCVWLGGQPNRPVLERSADRVIVETGR